MTKGKVFFSIFFLIVGAFCLTTGAIPKINEQPQQDIDKLRKEFQQDIENAKKITSDPSLKIFMEEVAPPKGLNLWPVVVVMGKEIFCHRDIYTGSYESPSERKTRISYQFSRKNDKIELLEVHWVGTSIPPHQEIFARRKIAEKSFQ